MDVFKDLFSFLINIYVYYADFIKVIVSIFFRNVGYIDFFTIYISFFIPVVLLYKRVVRDTFFSVSLNITIHIYLLLMVGFAIMGKHDIIFRDANGDLLDIAKGTFIWFLLTLFGIQTIAHKVSVVETAVDRVNEKNEHKKKNKKEIED